jgi:hypothetical protein
MNCGICSSPTRRVFDLRSRRHDVTVPVMRCKACDAYFSDGGPVNYNDVDLTGYYTASAPTIKARYERIFDEVGRLAAPGRFLDIGADMGKLAHGVGLEVLPGRFHHGRVFDNAAFRTFGLDDGYYFMKTRGERQ